MSIPPSAQPPASLSQVETQDQTQDTSAEPFYAADEDLDLNGSAEDDEAYCMIKASELEDSQCTDIQGQETMMYKEQQKEYEVYQRHRLEHGTPGWAKQ